MSDTDTSAQFFAIQSYRKFSKVVHLPGLSFFKSAMSLLMSSWMTPRAAASCFRSIWRIQQPTARLAALCRFFRRFYFIIWSFNGAVNNDWRIQTLTLFSMTSGSSSAASSSIISPVGAPEIRPRTATSVHHDALPWSVGRDSNGRNRSPCLVCLSNSSSSSLCLLVSWNKHSAYKHTSSHVSYDFFNTNREFRNYQKCQQTQHEIWQN